MSIDGFTRGFNPPDDSSNAPEKVSTPMGKIPAPQVEWQFYKIKVLEGVSEHKNSLFSTKNFWGFATN